MPFFIDQNEFAADRIDAPGLGVVERTEKLAFLIHDRRRACLPGTCDRAKHDRVARDCRPAAHRIAATRPGDGPVSAHLKDRLKAIDNAATADTFRQPTTDRILSCRLRACDSVHRRQQ